MMGKIKQDLCKQSDIGKKMMEFTQECIQSDKVNVITAIWPSMKTCWTIWQNSGKKAKVLVQDKVVGLSSPA